MDQVTLLNITRKIYDGRSDAKTIDDLVKVNIKTLLGNPNRILISDKSKAIKMIKAIIKALEHRLCHEPVIDVFRTRYFCDNYLEPLYGKTQRLQFLKIQCGMFPCFERWDMLKSVDSVGTKILDEIHNLSGTRCRRVLLPIAGPKNNSHDAAYSVLKVSAAFIRLWWSLRGRSEEENQGVLYTKIPELVQGMERWYRYINKQDIINGTREWIFTFLSKCTLSFVDERQDFIDAELFCLQTIKEFGEAPFMMLEFGKGICRSFCSKMDDQYFHESHMLLRMLENMAIQCKNQPEKEETLHIFMELVGYCTIQYGEASVDECITLASFFHTLAEEYFPKVGLMLEHYALALVVRDYASYRRWPNPKFSNANSIRDILIQLESHLQEFNHKNLQTYTTYTEFPAFLCDRIATFILSNYEEMIRVDEISRKLPSISGFLDRVMELGVSATCESQSTEYMKQVAKLAVTSFMFLLITKQETKGFLGKLMKDGKIQSAALTNFCQRLREVYQPLHNSGIVDQAIETLQLCCEASWTRVSLFCEMVKSSESNCFLEDRIVDIVNEAAKDSALLLNIIHQHHAEDVDSTLKTSIDRWVLAQEKFQILSPAALVTEWVTIQCQKKHTANLAPTIYSLVPSLRNSEQGSCIIILEELRTYRNMQNGDPQALQKFDPFLKLMENQIQDIIPTVSSSKHITDRINFLIDGGKLLASRGLKGQLDCIRYITEAVNLPLEYKKGDIKVKIGDELFRLLPEAFFLLSLIKRLACPTQKDYTKDIKSGLKLYLEKPPSNFSETECTLLSCILDLLSLEANVALQCEVYEIMIKSTGRNLKELLGIALQSGNLHHALCSSHVDDAFLEMVHKHYSVSTTDVLFWRTFVSSKSLEAGTHQSLSMLPTISYLELDDDTRSTKEQETIKEVKRAAQSLIASVSESKNEFAAANHYYNLAEIMIAKGLMAEALTYASEGYRLRNKLLLECFNIEWEGVTVDTNKYVCKTFYMHPSRLSSLGSYCVGTDAYVPTPWNLLRCYLESALQTGTLHYMIGNSSEAADMLHYGKAISSIQNFPVFLVGFSIALGNIHCKEKCWRLARRELDSARKSLDVCNLCKKCICILQVKLDQLEGDLNLSMLKYNGENAEFALIMKAKVLFEKAKSNLENKEWENSVSRPERETPTEKNPVLCHSNAASGSDDECWHCQTSIVEKSSSIENLNNLKWEIIRRRYLLQVITKLAKCSKLQKDIKEERRFLISGIYVLVGRSTFQELELSTSFVEEIVRKNVVAVALGAEQASILYKTCCFSLRHEDSSVMAILSREDVLMGLKMAFILSREVPKLHEKVSQILAVVYACSSTDDTLSEPERVSAVKSASYFHQCSIGSYFNSCFLSQDQNQREVDGSRDLRLLLAPRSMKELEESMPVFLESLSNSSVTVLCISMLRDKSYPILHKFLPERPNSVWIMISRFHLKIGHVVVILPVIETLTDIHYKKDTSVCEWTCPWAGNMFDQVAPVLRLVLEEDDRLNSVQRSFEVIKKRMNNDKSLRVFLRNLENSWLGQWKYLLLGECSDNSVFEGEQHCWEQLKSNHGCYIGTSGGKIDNSVKNNVGDTNEKKCRNPVIIVSHLSTQMIPLESLPILEKEEVYRMPSVGSILRSVSKKSKDLAVNPCKCYYLIMADHEDHRVELIKCFKDWSETFQFEGKAGILVEVSVDELKQALETHDLFIYAGHGDGTQYIPGFEIRKISNCCATILMGCSSGYLFSRYHVMESATLDYLLAGSPVVVANLWSVYSIGVQSFTKTLFEAWTNATTANLVECKSNLKECKSNLKKRGHTGMSLCKHGFNLGSAMAKARESCKRRYAEGAAAVIYGIPTPIERKKNRMSKQLKV